MLTLTTSLLGNTARGAGVPLTEQERDMLRWALETMGFVMPSRGVFTGQQWIDEIKAMLRPDPTAHCRGYCCHRKGRLMGLSLSAVTC